MSATVAGRTSHPWRRFLRFSVRGLIVSVLVIGGWLGWTVRNARIQRAAVAAVENAGGIVFYDLELTKGELILGGKPWMPLWLVDLIGLDYLVGVTQVHLNPMRTTSSFNDADIERLAGMTKLSVLNISGTKVSDAGLAHLSALTNLSKLDLWGTGVTHAGLAHLKGLTKLTFLDLGATKVSDSGLVHLNGLTNLSKLNLSGTQVTDAGLVHLKGLTKLSQVWLINRRVTDAGVRELQKALPSLTVGR